MELLLTTLCVLTPLQTTVCTLVTPPKGPTCTNITIPVIISATNAALPQNLGVLDILTFVNSVVSLAVTVPIHGPFNISATFCEPEVYNASRVNTLQFLNHGVTYTRAYWFGDYLSPRYSWVDYASKQGYPTLSIDRLGSGLSTQPDPILVVQYPASVEIAHSIIVLARTGQLPLPTPSARSFDTILYVGHSYGSVIGNNLNVHHPEDCDAVILTGFSSTVTTALGGVLALSGALPASVVEPGRFGALSAGYLEFTSMAGFRNLFFGPDGSFDWGVLDVDWRGRGTAAFGEAATIVFGTSRASGFKGQVYVMTGQYDTIFCNPTGLNGGLTSILGIGPQCVGGLVNYLENTRTLYPSASSFSYHVLPNSGHCWQLHYEAYAAFGAAHQWLALHGY